MATGVLAAARHARMVEARGARKRRSAMACAAILSRRCMCVRAEVRFADGDAVVMALGT